MGMMNVRKKNPFKDGINIVCEWINKKNWEVDFDYNHYDQMDEFERLITINKRNGEEKQLYSLLHECGHLLIRSNSKTFEKKHPFQAKAEAVGKNKSLERTIKYKVDVIAEEIEAWNRGLSLANRLNVFVNEKKYRNHMSECVFSYIRWSVKSRNSWK